MKLQSFTVIFAIIVIPISLVLSAYIQTHIDTIVLQTSYDTKLSNATYDAIKSFQLNTVNSKYSSVSDSKMRDIEASINTFFNSLGTNIGLGGYGQNVLKTYVPAMVYTLYDGYYIYSPYENTETGSYIHGLKPYIYYTCRYINGDIDVVVNYTLDNYIVIYGKIGNEYVTKAGYLIDTSLLKINNDGTVTYKGEKIDKESLTETLMTIEGNTLLKKEYTYVYIDGIKYYKDTDGKWFKYITTNFTKQKSGIPSNISNTDSSAINYYKEAKQFTEWVTSKLGSIEARHAVNVDTKDIVTGEIVSLFKGNTSKIFAIGSSNNPEEDGSDFNEHRREVIKHSIQTNLNSAIANYNENSQALDTTYNFKIPLISEEEWDKILNNICVISFLQGLPIGNKYYNNYCIISNSINKEYISPNSIELIAGDGNHHLFGCSLLFKSPANTSLVGYSNMNFVRQTIELNDELNYYYPHEILNCYRCIVDSKALYELEDILNNDTITLDGVKYSTDNLKKAYYQAYAREKYNLYKTNDYLNDYPL